MARKRTFVRVFAVGDSGVGIVKPVVNLECGSRITIIGLECML